MTAEVYLIESPLNFHYFLELSFIFHLGTSHSDALISSRP